MSDMQLANCDRTAFQTWRRNFDDGGY